MLIAGVIFFCSCRGEISPLQRFSQLLEQIASELEASKTELLTKTLHPDFEDQQGRNGDELIQWLSSLLQRQNDVVIYFLYHRQLQAPDAEQDGEVEVDLVVSSGRLKAVRKLVGFYGQLVRLNLTVAPGGAPWFVVGANWREIDLLDLGVEALQRFRTLYPDNK